MKNWIVASLGKEHLPNDKRKSKQSKIPPYTGVLKDLYPISLRLSRSKPLQIAGIKKHKKNVYGRPVQTEAACNALRTSFSLPSWAPATRPVAKPPSVKAQKTRWIVLHSSLPLAASVSTTRDPESEDVTKKRIRETIERAFRKGPSLGPNWPRVVYQEDSWSQSVKRHTGDRVVSAFQFLMYFGQSLPLLLGLFLKISHPLLPSRSKLACCTKQAPQPADASFFAPLGTQFATLRVN
mmetsp:Transcript_36398/g.71487  ORF Transcript_36398/g.71487 Transcript_36398/m.71487 type:complete len:238 (-) Transcript_36398:1625-2338(-)